MLTAHDVATAVFAKAVRGYRVEDVDAILDDVAAQLEANETEIAALKKANEELKANMYLLAQKIEEYRTDEENLKSALVNAQRMGENVIREAKQKGEGILRDATVRADSIVIDAQEENAVQCIELQRVRAEVAQFKADVLSLYKRHIESLSTLPETEDYPLRERQDEYLPEKPAVPAAPAPVPVPVQPDPPAPKPVPTPVQPEPVQAPVPEPEPAPVQTPQEVLDVNSFWAQDESNLSQAEAALTKEEQPVFQGFKGIKFSD